MCAPRHAQREQKDYLDSIQNKQNGRTAMHFAAKNGELGIVAYLDIKHPALYEVKDKVRQPPHSQKRS